MTSATHRPASPRHARQQGAALVVGLLLLVIITLLAVTGMTTANTELIMAGNEQQRQNGFRAAETGVDAAIRSINKNEVNTIPGTCLKSAVTDVFASSSDKYATGSAYLGSGGLVVGWGVNSGEANFYEVRSAGAGARGARTEVTQGVVKISSLTGAQGQSWGPIGNNVPNCQPNDLE